MLKFLQSAIKSYILNFVNSFSVCNDTKYIFIIDDSFRNTFGWLKYSVGQKFGQTEKNSHF